MAKRWYSVSVLSNFEKRIAEQIRTAVAEKGLEEVIEEVLVPEEDVIEIRRGKKGHRAAPLHAGLRAGAHGDDRRGLSRHQLDPACHRVSRPAGPPDADA